MSQGDFKSQYFYQKNIREFIFKRDGFKMFKTTEIDKLSLDHINPCN